MNQIGAKVGSNKGLTHFREKKCHEKEFIMDVCCLFRDNLAGKVAEDFKSHNA